MKITTMAIAGLTLALTPMTGCREQAPARVQTAEEIRIEKEWDANRKKVAALNEEYFKIPDEHILDDGSNSKLYTELGGRYKSDAAKLKELVEATGAKLVFIILTPEDKRVAISKAGIPFIKNVCSNLGIEVLDMTPALETQDVRKMTQVPRDGHWSKAGAIFIADHIAPVIKKYEAVASTVTYKEDERPETFGDLAPSSDEIRDGGKDLPYHVKANARGVRMESEIAFPKKKKHILFLGDSGIFCPFLNNEFTITAVLQQRFPNAVMMNTGVICYTLEDYVTLWNEKAKYSEPDIVFVQTNGGDITDYYFTHRNSLSRSHKPFYPTEAEEAYYKKHYSMGTDVEPIKSL